MSYFIQALDLLQAISIIIATVVAIYSVNLWRKEVRWKREYEISEETLILFYEAKDALKAIRYPLSSIAECEDRKASVDETAEEKAVLDAAYIVNKRYQMHSNVFIRLQAIRYHFMAIFGQDKQELFIEFQDVVNKVLILAKTMAGHGMQKKGDLTDVERAEYTRIMKEAWGVMYLGFNRLDQIDEQVNAIIGKVEDVCKPYLLMR